MTLRVAVLIDAPIAEVWAAVADLASHSEWMVDAESIRFRTQQREGTGTVMEVVTRIGPLSTVDIMEVTAWEPPKRIEVRHIGLVSGVGEFRLDPMAGGVLFTWSEDLRFPRWLGGQVGSLLARPLLRLIWKGNLNRLQARLTRN